ncbi:MAG: hypothetical protein J5867_05565 [Prevotella sp.]|nr:hypothetical protein [Prevotella sp.]
MKKMTFILACLTMAALSANAQISKVILQHQGNVTMYEPDDIQTAIKDAVDGDTILLNKGSYPGFTVDKKISVIGAGDGKTQITSDIEIAITYINNQAQELTANMLEGLNLSLSNKSIRVTKAVNGLKLKKCSFYTLIFRNAVKDVFIDRCTTGSSIYCYIDLTNVVSLKAKNSWISYLEGKPSSQKLDDVEFINCYFDRPNVSEKDVVANFVNSWFYGVQTYASNCTYNYCLVRTEITKDNKDFYPGSYYTSTAYYYNENGRLAVASNNYLGNDGTVVGPDGGTTPYTLTTTAPKILDESSAVVSTDMKALNVNIKVTPN